MTSLTPRFLHNKVILAPLAVALLMAASALSTHAAVSAPTPANSNAEAKFKLDCWAAENSVLQRTKVAQQRYQQKLDRRASLVEGLKAELAMKQQTVTVGRQPGVEQPPQSQGAERTSFLVWLMLALACALPVRYFWRRPASRPLQTLREAAPSVKYPVVVSRGKAVPVVAKVKSQPQPSTAAPVRPRGKTPASRARRNASRPARQRQPLEAWVLSASP